MTLFDFLNPHDLLGRATLSLIALAFITAPMGCFVVWRKMSYFGATLSHSAILGAILGLVTGVGVMTGVIGFTLVLALILSLLLRQRQLATDTILGMMAHFTLATGVIAVSVMSNLRIDLMAYLFGDILAISLPMLIYLSLFVLLGLAIIIYYWKSFVNLSINKEIAQVEGYSVNHLEIIFMLSLALTISLGMLTIGVLLIIAILIIPAATARLFATSVLSMVIITWIATIISIGLGMLCAYQFNFPAGASVVAISGILFIFSKLLKLKTF